jgi:endo-1,4-beta-xylanase
MTRTPLAAQAAAYADVFAACLAVTQCRGITTWGISDADTWLDTQPLFDFFAPNRPLLFDESLAPKPAHDAVVATLLAVPEPGAAATMALGLALLGESRIHPDRSAKRPT